MVSIRMSSRFIGAVLLCGTLGAADGQSAIGQKCPSVTPKNPQEAVMMEAAAGKDGCWTRDSRTGLLMFVSSLTPDRNYPPLQAPPAVSKPASGGTALLAHGVNNPALFGKIVGTWQGTFCGLNVGTFTFSAAGTTLNGRGVSREMIMNQDVTSCERLAPRLDGAPVTTVFSNLGFDGQVLWGIATGSLNNRPLQVPFTIAVAGNTIITPSRQLGVDPTIFRRVGTPAVDSTTSPRTAAGSRPFSPTSRGTASPPSNRTAPGDVPPMPGAALHQASPSQRAAVSATAPPPRSLPALVQTMSNDAARDSPAAAQNGTKTSGLIRSTVPEMTNVDVLKMLSAGISPDTVVLAIRAAQPAFDTSTDALIGLKRQGVPDQVLQAMLSAKLAQNVGTPAGAAGNYASPASAGVSRAQSADLPFPVRLITTLTSASQDSALRGVVVTERTGDSIIVVSVETGTQAWNAGLRTGDKPARVYTGGPDGPGRGGGWSTPTPDAFYRLAAKCVPDCLVMILGSGGRGGDPSVIKAVGSLGNKFSAIIRSDNSRGYIDNETQTFYPFTLGPARIEPGPTQIHPIAAEAVARTARDEASSSARNEAITPQASSTNPISVREATQASIQQAEQQLQGLRDRFAKESRDLDTAQSLAQLARLGCNMSTGPMKTSNCFQADLQDIGVASKQRNLKQLEREIQDADGRLNALRARR